MTRCVEDMLDRDEGKEYQAYPDPLSPCAVAARKGLPTLGLDGAPWTIGKGHTGPEVHQGLVWNDDQIDYAFQLDVAEAWTDCQNHFEPWFSQLSEPRQAVLVCMVYQMGIDRVLKFVNTLAAVRDQHFALAADGMRSSVWGKQTPKRVNRLAIQMEQGAWQ